MLCGPAGLAVFSCGIRLTPLEAVTDSCPCQKAQRNQALVLLVNKWSIQQRYQFSHMLLLGPFRTIHSYFDNSASIAPTSVSHYNGCCLSTPQYMPNVRSLSSTITEIASFRFSLVVLEGPSNCRKHAVSPKREVSRDGLESS